MKKLFMYLGVFLLSHSASAQGQLENNGFEDWEALEINDTLDNWFSILGTFYPNDPNVSRIEDGVSGAAVRLETVANMEGEVSQAGIILANSVGDDGPDGYPYDSDVDQLNAYMRFDIEPEDTGFVLVFLENGGDPFSYNVFPIFGTEDTWELFTWELSGLDLTPDAVSIAFFSSGYSDSDPIAGSWLEVDNVYFTNDGPSPDPILNFNFEDWTTVEIEVSSNWNSFDPIFRSFFGITNLSKSTDASAGDFSLKMEVLDVNIVEDIYPFISNGTFNFVTEDFDGGTPYTDDPLLFKGQYKLLSGSGDSARVYLRFWNDEGDEAEYADTVLLATEDWTEFSIPIDLDFTPDSVLTVLLSGKMEGAETYFDDVRFVYDDLSVPKQETINIRAYPNPSSSLFTLEVDQTADLIITDLIGKTVYRENEVNEFTLVKTSDWTNGTYIIQVIQGNQLSTKRIVVQH